MSAMKRRRTYMAKSQEVKPQWHLVDASERPLGRMAVQVARMLQGKHRPTFTPHLLTGDIVVVVNAAKTRVTGNKMAQELYYHHSGYPGGLRQVPMEQMMARDPTKIVFAAVKGMLPKNTLGERMLKRLHVYAGPEHPHQGQLGPVASQTKQERSA